MAMPIEQPICCSAYDRRHQTMVNATERWFSSNRPFTANRLTYFDQQENVDINWAEVYKETRYPLPGLKQFVQDHHNCTIEVEAYPDVTVDDWYYETLNTSAFGRAARADMFEDLFHNEKYSYMKGNGLHVIYITGHAFLWTRLDFELASVGMYWDASGDVPIPFKTWCKQLKLQLECKSGKQPIFTASASARAFSELFPGKSAFIDLDLFHEFQRGRCFAYIAAVLTNSMDFPLTPARFWEWLKEMEFAGRPENNTVVEVDLEEGLQKPFVMDLTDDNYKPIDVVCIN